jgi:hypothetical protein
VSQQSDSARKANRRAELGLKKLAIASFLLMTVNCGVAFTEAIVAYVKTRHNATDCIRGLVALPGHAIQQTP